MLQSIIHRLFKRRHFWRHATFSEVAELYASRLMTMFALRFVLVFVSVYLYKLDYDLQTIALFWAGYFFLKALFAWPAARIAAHYGPKHGLLMANILFAVALAFLYGGQELGFYALVPWCFLQAFAGSLNQLCYLIDFSKVKHADHAGKELGYMNIIEKVAAGISPLAGGVIASVFGPSSAMVLSAIFFLFSAVPLLRTAEQTHLNQKLHFIGFPWHDTWRSLRAQLGVGLDVFASGNAWVLFITIIVFAHDGDEIYAKVGVFTSLGLIVALSASYVFGRLIDHRQGLLLLRTSVVINSLTHLFRPTVGSALGVVANNAVNDVATTGYNMAFTRGMFDTADMSGFRIVYLYLGEALGNLGASLWALLLAGLVMVLSEGDALRLLFILTAAASLLIITPRFALYRR